MSSVIYTNTASLVAQKNLLGAQNSLASSVERLSSGLRINRARDDAAGLSVANSLQTQINGANQGIRNMNDAISMVQTAEGAIAAASDMGQRILTLATQGANGTLGATEKEAIINEMNKLLSSINSIASRTTYAGNALLSESASFLGKAETVSMTSAAVLTAGQALEIGGLTYTAGSGGANSAQVLAAFAGLSEGATTGEGTATGSYTGKLAGYSTSIVNNGAVTFTSRSLGNVTDLAKAGTGAAAATLVVTAGVNSTAPLSAFSMQISNSSSDVIALTQDAFLNIGLGNFASNLYSNGQASTLANKVAAGSSASNFWKEIQTAASDYVKSLSTQRSDLGAFQNQMEYTLSNITELSANLSASRSRVIDTDYAAETASLTRGQILQQAATAMLAQANQMPNVILTLLK